MRDVISTDGTLPDFEGKPVIASCRNCRWVSEISDGPEYRGSFYVCEMGGKEHMSNLKGFPFKTAQKCCELHSSHMIDWAAEARKASKEDSGNV